MNPKFIIEEKIQITSLRATCYIFDWLRRRMLMQNNSTQQQLHLSKIKKYPKINNSACGAVVSFYKRYQPIT